MTTLHEIVDLSISKTLADAESEEAWREALSQTLVTELRDAGFELIPPSTRPAPPEQDPTEAHVFGLTDEDTLAIWRGPRTPGSFLPNSVARDIERAAMTGEADVCGNCGSVLPKGPDAFSGEELVMLEWGARSAFLNALTTDHAGTGTWMHCSATLWNQLADRVCTMRGSTPLPEPRGNIVTKPL